MKLNRYSIVRSKTTNVSPDKKSVTTNGDFLDSEHNKRGITLDGTTTLRENTSSAFLIKRTQSVHTPRQCKIQTELAVNKENDKYSVSYYFSQAIIGLIINMTHLIFGPISILPLRMIFGKFLMHGMLFDLNILYFVGDFTSWSWVFLTIIFDFFNPDIREQMAVIYIGTGSVVFLRQILVSLKYGFYSKSRWETMRSTWVSQDWVLENLILPSWIRVSPKMSESEIISSLAKENIDHNILIFRFKHMPEWTLDDEQNPGNTLEPIIANETNVTILKIAKVLIHRVALTQKSTELKIIDIGGLFYILSFIILRYYGFGLSGFRADPFEIIYTIISSLKAYIASVQFVKFIAAGLFDFKRKRTLMAQCTGLISKVDQKFLLVKGDKKKPKIDLNDPLTVLSWYYLRRSFLDFGKRFTLRVFLYASLVLPICITVVLVLLLQLAGLVAVTYNYYLVPSLYLTLEVFIMIAHMSTTALSLNKTFSVHRDLLLENLIKAKNKENANNLAIANLSFVIERLKHDEIIRPVKIMGVVINEDFIVKLIIVAMSGIFAIVQLALRS